LVDHDLAFADEGDAAIVGCDRVVADRRLVDGEPAHAIVVRGKPVVVDANVDRVAEDHGVVGVAGDRVGSNRDVGRSCGVVLFDAIIVVHDHVGFDRDPVRRVETDPVLAVGADEVVLDRGLVPRADIDAVRLVGDDRVLLDRDVVGVATCDPVVLARGSRFGVEGFAVDAVVTDHDVCVRVRDRCRRSRRARTSGARRCEDSGRDAPALDQVSGCACSSS
jgi:hypothetical protein